MNKILIATTNKGKFQEIKQVLADLPFEFLSLSQLGLVAQYPENAQTFAENAIGKAQYYFQEIQGEMPVIADDSGIVVDVLKAELGVKTRRWGAGEKATDQEWIDFFLEKIKDIPLPKRTARFICAAALCYGLSDGQGVGPDAGLSLGGKAKVFEYCTEGIITQKLEAEIVPGLPLSSCFKPLGFEQVFAALGVAQKNTISHRGKAFNELKVFLKDLSLRK